MATVLVTGGAGNIGSFIVDQLVELGHFVVVVDNFYNGKLDELAPSPGVGGGRSRGLRHHQLPNSRSYFRAPST